MSFFDKDILEELSSYSDISQKDKEELLRAIKILRSYHPRVEMNSDFRDSLRRQLLSATKKKKQNMYFSFARFSLIGTAVLALSFLFVFFTKFIPVFPDKNTLTPIQITYREDEAFVQDNVAQNTPMTYARALGGAGMESKMVANTVELSPTKTIGYTWSGVLPEITHAFPVYKRIPARIDMPENPLFRQLIAKSGLKLHSNVPNILDEIRIRENTPRGYIFTISLTYGTLLVTGDPEMWKAENCTPATGMCDRKVLKPLQKEEIETITKKWIQEYGLSSYGYSGIIMNPVENGYDPTDFPKNRDLPYSYAVILPLTIEGNTVFHMSTGLPIGANLRIDTVAKKVLDAYGIEKIQLEASKYPYRSASEIEQELRNMGASTQENNTPHSLIRPRIGYIQHFRNNKEYYVPSYIFDDAITGNIVSTPLVKGEWRDPYLQNNTVMGTEK